MIWKPLLVLKKIDYLKLKTKKKTDNEQATSCYVMFSLFHCSCGASSHLVSINLIHSKICVLNIKILKLNYDMLGKKCYN